VSRLPKASAKKLRHVRETDVSQPRIRLLSPLGVDLAALNL